MAQVDAGGSDGSGDQPAAPGARAFGPNAWLVEDMYDRFRSDPTSVSDSWREFFADYRPPGAASVPAPTASPSAGPSDGTQSSSNGSSGSAAPSAAAGSPSAVPTITPAAAPATAGPVRPAPEAGRAPTG